MIASFSWKEKRENCRISKTILSEKQREEEGIFCKVAERKQGEILGISEWLLSKE